MPYAICFFCCHTLKAPCVENPLDVQPWPELDVAIAFELEQLAEDAAHDDEGDAVMTVVRATKVRVKAEPAAPQPAVEQPDSEMDPHAGDEPPTVEVALRADGADESDRIDTELPHIVPRMVVDKSDHDATVLGHLLRARRRQAPRVHHVLGICPPP